MAVSARILVVDDEPQILRAVRRGLVQRGYEVDTAGDGVEALEVMREFAPQLLVLDLNLPRMDGLSVCERVRAQSDIPILVLSVREAEEDKIAALDIGADDYLNKPFSTGELLARVRALLRRSEPGQRPLDASRFQSAGVLIDLLNQRVTKDGDDVRLTKTEWRLLETLATRPGKLLTHGWLLENVWGSGYDQDLEVLRVFISQLRKKIEPDPRTPKLIATEPGIGYRWLLEPGELGGGA
jgi:two-component system KDP operon response regulator KdpE